MPTVFAVSTARGYQGTSTSTVPIGTGTATFVTSTDLAYSPGARIRTSDSTNTNNWMEGTVVSYVGGSLVANMDSYSGSGSPSTWNLNLAGQPGQTGPIGSTGPQGPTGATGPGYLATSTTSLPVNGGAHTFTVAPGLAYTVGARVRASSNAVPTNWMEGIVTAYSGTSMTVTVDSFNGGAGPFSDWNLNIAGLQGIQGIQGVQGPIGPAGPTGSTGAQGPPGTAVHPTGAWSAGTTYSQFDGVTYNGQTYVSLVTPNLNHQPDTSPTYWQPAAGGASQTPWLSDIDAATKTLFNAGKIGIGVPTAAAVQVPLTVSGNAAALPAAPTGTMLQIGAADNTTARITLDAFGSNPSLTFRAALGTAASPLASSLNTLLGAIVGFGRGATGYAASGRALLAFYAAENWTDAAQGTYIAFQTTPIGSTTIAERMRIDAAGNVGIGIVPAQILHTKVASGDSVWRMDTATKAAGILKLFDATGDVALQTSATPNAIYVQAGGNVGIGTASPGAKLDVWGAGNILRLYNPSTAANNNEYLQFAGGNGLFWAIGVDLLASNGSKDLHFYGYYAATNPVLTITSGGLVGIGTPSPNGTLQVRATTDQNLILASMNWALSGAVGFNAVNDANSANIPFVIAASIFNVRSNQVGIGNDGTVLPHVAVGGYVYEILGPTSGGGLGELTLCANVAATSGTSIGSISFANYNLTGAEKRTCDFNCMVDGSPDAGALMVRTQPNVATGLLPRLWIGSNGNVRIGTTATSPTYKLQVDGDINISGTGVVYRVNGVPISTGGGISSQSTTTGHTLGNNYQAGSKPIFVVVTVSITNSSVQAFTDAGSNPSTQVAAVGSTATGIAVQVAFWVLPSNWYRVTAGGSPTLTSWVEWS